MIDQIGDQEREAIIRELRNTSTRVLTNLAQEFPRPLDAYGVQLLKELESRKNAEFARFRITASGGRVGDSFGWVLTNCDSDHGFWFDGAHVGYVELYNEIDSTLFAIMFPEAVRLS